MLLEGGDDEPDEWHEEDDADDAHGGRWQLADDRLAAHVMFPGVIGRS